MAKHSLRQKPSGPMMRDQLRSMGIEAQQVTQRRETGFYVAEFYHNKMQSPVESSHQWAEVIHQRLANSTIIDRYDTVADWRDGKPVIWASVTFRVD